MEKTIDEILNVDGWEIGIKYSEYDNPETLQAMKALLERQRISQKNDRKFDVCGEK